MIFNLIGTDLAADLEIFLKRKINKITAVTGGDINEAYKLECDDKSFFVKINDHEKYPDIFDHEKQGLETLHAAGAHTPEIVSSNHYNNSSFLILEYLPPSNPTFSNWENLGKSLASLHKNSYEYFGFHSDNYLATLPQKNAYKSSWIGFYSENRILPLVKVLRDKNLIDKAIQKKFEKFCDRINEIYPSELPALLHGDLWSGNVHFSNDKFYFIDPAVYFGHREIDIAMTSLFGGFPSHFYDSYNEAFPLDASWEERMVYSQLYPLLIHVNLFGSSYLKGIQSTLKKF